MSQTLLSLALFLLGPHRAYSCLCSLELLLVVFGDHRRCRGLNLGGERARHASGLPMNTFFQENIIKPKDLLILLLPQLQAKGDMKAHRECTLSDQEGRQHTPSKEEQP